MLLPSPHFDQQHIHLIPEKLLFVRRSADNLDFDFHDFHSAFPCLSIPFLLQCEQKGCVFMNSTQYAVLKAIYHNTSETVSYVPYSVFSRQVPDCPDAFQLLSLIPSAYFESQKDVIDGVRESCFCITPEGIDAISEYEQNQKRDKLAFISLSIGILTLIVSILGLFN